MAPPKAKWIIQERDQATVELEAKVIQVRIVEIEASINELTIILEVLEAQAERLEDELDKLDELKTTQPPADNTDTDFQLLDELKPPSTTGYGRGHPD